MNEPRTLSSPRVKRLSPLVAMITLLGAFFALGAPAEAGTISGYACAYRLSVSLFGGPANVRGCAQTIPPGDAGSASPEVTLPAGGTNSLISQTDNDGARAQVGPAVFFGGFWAADDTVPPSGQLMASTTGISTVVSTATANTVGPSPFHANSVLARCTANTAGKTYTVTLSGAVVETSTDADGNPLTIVNVPSSPSVNYSVPFTINSVGDHGVAVFNERITNGDGSVTLNAMHMYMQGPTAIGDMIIGQATCGH